MRYKDKQARAMAANAENLASSNNAQLADVVHQPALNTINASIVTNANAITSNNALITANNVLIATNTNAITGLGSGSPSGIYATVALLTTAYPTGNTKIYLVTADGTWRYWTAGAWTSGGVYQSTGIAPGSVNYATTDSYVSNNIRNNKTLLSGVDFNNIQQGGSYTSNVWAEQWISGEAFGEFIQSNTITLNSLPSLKVLRPYAPNKSLIQAGVLFNNQSCWLSFYVYVTNTAINNGFKFVAGAGYSTVLYQANFSAYVVNSWNQVKIQITGVPTSNLALLLTGQSDFYISKLLLSYNGNDQYDLIEYTKNIGSSVANGGVKQNITVLSPNRVYDVCNDSVASTEAANARHTVTPMFVDYLVNQATDITFQNGKDRYIFEEVKDPNYGTPFNNSLTVLNQNIDIPLVSSNYNVSDLNVTQISTIASHTGNKMFCLCIGDSQTDGGLSEGNLYWRDCAKQFLQEDMDFWRATPPQIQMLGTRDYVADTVTYNNQTKSCNSSAEGRPGWTLYSYLRHATEHDPTQANWDLLGLGNGTHTDFTGTFAQMDLIATTSETNSATVVDNPFFDNTKTGIKFSIAKWIAQYRTLDDSGNILALGSGTGSLITSGNIATINVCTPTHIFVRLGQNDFGKCDPSVFQTNVLALISEIRTELPNVYIIIGLALPSMGTWHPERYPNWFDLPTPAQAYWYNNAQYWSAYFKTYNQETNKVFLLEEYYFSPVSDGFYHYSYSDGLNTYCTPFGVSNTIHPNSTTNFQQGYHLYALLKYLRTLS